MDLPANRLMFVDNHPPFVEKAIELGMHGAVMVRKQEPATSLPCVTGLLEVIRLLDT